MNILEKMICGSMWAVWLLVLAERPKARVAIGMVRLRRDEDSAARQLYPDRPMLPGW